VAVLYGLRLASAATVSMWLNLELAATAVLGVLIFKDHLGRAGWLGAGGTFAAALLLTWQEGAAGPAAFGFLAAAGLCWGLDNHLTALIDNISPARSTLFKGIAAGMTNTAIGLATEPFSTDWALVAAALALGAFSYGISICLYILSAQNLGATRSQMVFSAAPFFGVLLSVVILGESLSVLQILAALLLMLSLAVLFRDRHGHFHTHDPMAHTHRHSHGDGHHDHIHPGPSRGCVRGAGRSRPQPLACPRCRIPQPCPLAGPPSSPPALSPEKKEIPGPDQPRSILRMVPHFSEIPCRSSWSSRDALWAFGVKASNWISRWKVRI
jgi:threonine/homoserine efflux transporter RhtA